jgi:hypothetical protein
VPGDFIETMNPTTAFYDAFINALYRLPSWLASIYVFEFYFFGAGLPLAVLLYIAYCICKAPSGKRCSVYYVLLGGIEVQTMYFFGSMFFLEYAMMVVLPVLAASRDDVLPWVMLVTSQFALAFSVVVVARMFGSKMCRMRGMDGYGRRGGSILRQIKAETLAMDVELGTVTGEVDEGNSTLPEKIRRLTPADESKAFKECAATLENGESDISQALGRDWSTVMTGSEFNSTEIRLLNEAGLVYQENGRVAVNDPGRRSDYQLLKSYSCTKRNHMSNMLWQLLYGGKRVKRVFVYDRSAKASG